MGDVFVNTVGTFGVSSAAYWWGRLAAAVHRTGLAVVSALWPLWALLFADDWNLMAEADSHQESLLGFTWWLTVLNVPLSWHKVKGGVTFPWVGCEVDLRQWPLGISASRAEWAVSWMSRTLDEGCVDPAVLREALGRLVFVYGALQ